MHYFTIYPGLTLIPVLERAQNDVRRADGVQCRVVVLIRRSLVEVRIASARAGGIC